MDFGSFWKIVGSSRIVENIAGDKQVILNKLKH